MRSYKFLLITTIVVIIIAAIAFERLSQNPALPEAETIAIVPGAVNSESWAEDSSKLITEQREGIVTIWDVSENPPENQMLSLGHEFWVTGAVIDPSQSYLAAGSVDGTVVIWNLGNNTLHYTSQPHSHSIHRIVWSSDSRIVAFSSADGISVVNVETASEIQRFDEWVSSLTWIPETHLLVGGTMGITVWDTETGNVVKEINYTGRPHLLSPNGRRMLASGVWNIATEQEISNCLECFVATQSFAWSPDSQQVAIGSGRFMCFEGSFYCVEDFNIRVWNVDRDVMPALLSGHTDSVIALVWHPDGSKITSVSLDNTARIWDVQSHTLLQTFYIGNIDYQGQAIINSNGTMIAVNEDDSVRILNLPLAD